MGRKSDVNYRKEMLGGRKVKRWDRDRKRVICAWEREGEGIDGEFWDLRNEIFIREREYTLKDRAKT